MTKKDLKRLRRRDLLEMPLDLRKENDALKTKVAQMEMQLTDKEIQIVAAGSIAEASLQLNGIFEAAQAACDQYEQNVRLRCDQMEQEAKLRCEAMLSGMTDRIE